MSERVAGKVARLEEALEDPVDGRQAAEIIRGRVHCILLTPGQAWPGVELRGDLAVILAGPEEAGDHKKLPGRTGPGSQLSVVAGARY